MRCHPSPSTTANEARRPQATRVGAMLAALGLVIALVAPVRAQSTALSEVSALSALPVAVALAVPVMLSAGVAQLTVVGVQASAQGTEWVLMGASDGARLSLRVAGGASVAAGTVLQVTAVGAGWVLSAAGQAVAFVPNTVGLALMHHEQVAR